MQRFEGLDLTTSRDAQPERRKPQIFWSDYIFPANQQRVVDDIFQFSRIAWPGVPAHQHIDPLRAQCGILKSQPFPINSEKILRQGQNVTRTFAQRRNMQRGNLQPVIKIFAEASGGNRIL